MEKDRNRTEGNDKIVVTVDAVHPRFIPKETSSTRSSFFAFCSICNSQLDNRTEALRLHFNTCRHTSTCVYCHGPVYKYIYGQESGIHYFHECTGDVFREEKRRGSDYEHETHGPGRHTEEILNALEVQPSSDTSSETSSSFNASGIISDDSGMDDVCLGRISSKNTGNEHT